MAGVEDVLERLVNDPAFRAELQRDPEAALAGYELDESERALLAAQVSTDAGGSGSVEQRTSKAGLVGLVGGVMEAIQPGDAPTELGRVEASELEMIKWGTPIADTLSSMGGAPGTATGEEAAFILTDVSDPASSPDPVQDIDALRISSVKPDIQGVTDDTAVVADLSVGDDGEPAPAADGDNAWWHDSPSVSLSADDPAAGGGSDALESPDAGAEEPQPGFEFHDEFVINGENGGTAGQFAQTDYGFVDELAADNPAEEESPIGGYLKLNDTQEVPDDTEPPLATDLDAADPGRNADNIEWPNPTFYVPEVDDEVLVGRFSTTIDGYELAAFSELGDDTEPPSATDLEAADPGRSADDYVHDVTTIDHGGKAGSEDNFEAAVDAVSSAKVTPEN